MPLDITFDKKTPISKKQFFKKYDICNIKPSPKHLKVGRDFQEEEMEAIFGRVISKNGYRYCHTNDEVLIAKVKTLWMTTL
jgi:hypothetical protein